MRPRRVFYGWYVIAVAMVGAFLCGGLTSQVFFSVVLKPMSSDLGWSRSEVTGAITLGTVASAALAPMAGALADRYGPRIIAPVGATFVALALMLLADLHSLAVFYAAYITARGLSSATVTGVVSGTLAANWFRRMRGRAFGLVSMSVALGGSAGAVAAQPIIDGPGWRTVFIVFPSLLLVLFVGPALLIYRRRPEDLGLLPDGDSEPVRAATRDSRAATPELSWTVAEAARTRALWLLIAGMFIGTMASGAVSFHLVAYYTDKGLSSGVAASSISLYALFGALAAFVWGFLVERVSERLLLTAAMLMGGATLALMLPVESPAAGLAVAALYGLAARGEGTLVNTILAQYYGRESYGRIAGLVSPFNMVALGLGPLIASLSFDLTGSYDDVFVIFSVTSLGASALLWLARRPVRPAAGPTPEAAVGAVGGS